MSMNIKYNQNTRTLTWDPVANAQEYTIVISEAGGNILPAYTPAKKETSTTHTIAPKVLVAGKKYKVDVTVFNGVGINLGTESVDISCPRDWLNWLKAVCYIGIVAVFTYIAYLWTKINRINMINKKQDIVTSTPTATPAKTNALAQTRPAATSQPTPDVSAPAPTPYVTQIPAQLVFWNNGGVVSTAPVTVTMNFHGVLPFPGAVNSGFITTNHPSVSVPPWPTGCTPTRTVEVPECTTNGVPFVEHTIEVCVGTGDDVEVLIPQGCGVRWQTVRPVVESALDGVVKTHPPQSARNNVQHRDWRFRFRGDDMDVEMVKLTYFPL